MPIATGGTAITSAGQIANGVITNTHVSASAAIAASKLNLTGAATMRRTVHPNQGAVNQFFTGVYLDFNTGQPTWKFEDAVADQLTVQVEAPFGATSIASIKVYYLEEGVASTNLRLTFYTTHSPVQTAGGTYQNDQTDVEATYASGGTQFKLYSITVPAGAYDALTGIVAGSLVALNIARAGASASDTYGIAWSVVGVEFNFA